MVLIKLPPPALWLDFEMQNQPFLMRFEIDELLIFLAMWKIVFYGRDLYELGN